MRGQCFWMRWTLLQITWTICYISWTFKEYYTCCCWALAHGLSRLSTNTPRSSPNHRSSARADGGGDPVPPPQGGAVPRPRVAGPRPHVAGGAGAFAGGAPPSPSSLAARRPRLAEASRLHEQVLVVAAAAATAGGRRRRPHLCRWRLPPPLILRVGLTFDPAKLLYKLLIYDLTAEICNEIVLKYLAVIDWL